MNPLRLAALLAVCAAPLFAADAVADKKTKRTLKEVVELAMREGKDATLDPNLAERFGLGRLALPEKRLRFKSSICPDNREHDFRVVLRQTAVGAFEPIALHINEATAKLVDGKIYADGVVFKASLSGSLEKAFHNKGFAGQIEPQELSTKSSEIKKQFKEELDFHQRVVVQKGLEFTK